MVPYLVEVAEESLEAILDSESCSGISHPLLLMI
jgi:hypothetical protein